MKALLVALSLAACGGAAAAAEPDLDGWCCDGICGVDATQKEELDWRECTCDGIVRGNGECDVRAQ